MKLRVETHYYQLMGLTHIKILSSQLQYRLDLGGRLLKYGYVCHQSSSYLKKLRAWHIMDSFLAHLLAHS